MFELDFTSHLFDCSRFFLFASLFFKLFFVSEKIRLLSYLNQGLRSALVNCSVRMKQKDLVASEEEEKSRSLARSCGGKAVPWLGPVGEKANNIIDLCLVRHP